MHDGENRVTGLRDSATEEFGPYRVYERLGIGGMATVHRAKKRGVAGFERGVALKRMLPHLSEDAEFVNSFVREAKMASLLVHPNIAQIYDFGLIDNVYYIAMEHVDGHALNRLLRDSQRHNTLPPVNVALSILCELCAALEYAHTLVDENGQPQGMVHRDVSPANLIVAQTGHLKVIDFGIATALSRQLHTESGQVKGKFGYMSPEAAQGQPVGPSSDVFSAGVVAHELLTTRPLFYGKSDYDILRRVREAEILPPSRTNPRVPALLDQVVLAALERDDRRRLQTAREFREALEQVVIEGGIRLSSNDVAEWARGTMISERGGTRELLPIASRSAVRGFPQRGFPQPVSPGSLSRMHPPVPAELYDGQQQEHPAGPRSRPIGAVSPVDPRRSDPLIESDAHPALLSGSVDRVGALPLPVSGMRMPSSQPAHPPRLRSRTPAIIALGTLCTIAAGLAVYQFVMRPTAAVAPPPLASPPAPPGPPTHTLVKFIVRPPDSIVEIGGNEVSRQSPFEIPLERGVYSVAVTRTGYKRWTSQIALRDPESQTVNVALESAAAIVRLSSQPAGLVAELDGKSLDQVTPAEFETLPGPHRLVVVGPTGTWAEDFVAAVDGTYTFHAVLPPVKRATTTSGAARTAPSAPDRTPPRAASGSAARTSAARAVIEPEEHVIDLGAESLAAKPLPKPEPLTRPAAQLEPTVTSPPALPRPVPRLSTPPLVPASTVTKLSGEVPAIQSGSGSADVYSKICIGPDGHVTSAKIIRPSAGIAAELQRTLLGWRYKPYLDDAGQPSPACFAVNFRLVFERAH
jgi:serine/threonine protein kinase